MARVQESGEWGQVPGEFCVFASSCFPYEVGCWGGGQAPQAILATEQGIDFDQQAHAARFTQGSPPPVSRADHILPRIII